MTSGPHEELPQRIGPYSLWPQGNSIRVYCPYDLRHPVLRVRGAMWSPALRGWLVPAVETDALLAEVRAASRMLAAAISGRPVAVPKPERPAQAVLDFGELPTQTRPKGRGRKALA